MFDRSSSTDPSPHGFAHTLADPKADLTAAPPHVAVIGAGVSGLSCARQLQQAGFAVTVFEQSDVVGGRLATRRTEIGGFDYGAQYCTARSAAFTHELEDWQRASVIAPWDGMLVAQPERRGAVRSDTLRRHVGVPGMSAIASHLAEGMDVRLEQRINRLERLGSGTRAGWILKRAADPHDFEGLEITEGIYDVVVAAVPAALAVELLAPAQKIGSAARQVLFAPCWSLMLGFVQPVDAPFDAAVIGGPRLNWIARDSSKPGRRAGERWVAHAGPLWSEEHRTDDPADVRTKLVKAFMEATGGTIQPVYAAVYRWHWGMPTSSLSEPFLWDSKLRLGACGDWCGGASLEQAWLSGRALAQEISGLRAAPILS